MHTPVKPAHKKHGGSSRTVQSIAALAAIAMAGLIWYLLLDRDVRLSEHGYELSKALYATCNLEDTKRLAAFERALRQYPLAPKELSKMEPIVDLANAGQWQAAAARARALLESQEIP